MPMKQDINFMDPINRDLEARRAARRILNVSENADREILQRAFRKVAGQVHPDHAGNTEEANRRFILARCAYELLAHDRLCEELLEQVDKWLPVPEDNTYRLDNPWGHFLWWQEKYFGIQEKPKTNERRSCI